MLCNTLDDNGMDESNSFGIDVKEGRYKVIKADSNIVYVDAHDHGSMDDNTMTAMVIILIFVSILCGLICFIFGLSVGGGIGYGQGKKAQKMKNHELSAGIN